jgi:hypothetical protein
MLAFVVILLSEATAGSGGFGVKEGVATSIKVEDPKLRSQLVQCNANHSHSIPGIAHLFPPAFA